ncbi:MAG TPA: tRNA preQ1(34) S-adenosylmethionine ribosyltransferase-isomerase QueA [Alphaproteobacteria bacterium]|nr:tRNA preQ1(34) S-adenosylmethionine ribosyltransferase-isomerase QueA [Alphaproteobacteria bacterium]
MRIEEFDFNLPPELIADRPVTPRDASRLLHLLPDRIEDRRFLDLPALLREGDLLVFNDTKVIPSRLVGRRGAAAIEATLHMRAAGDRWRAFARPARRLKPGDRIEFASDLFAEVTAKGEGGEVELDFSLSGPAFMSALEHYGSMPLPPYIKRDDGADARDRTDYQTLFARVEGAVAAPTAGLHFTQRIMDALKARGVDTAAVTLHVGAGTFLPVKAKRVEDHRMHPERGEIGRATVEAITAARARGGRVIAVGTTSLRLLETAAADGLVRPFKGETALYILPGFRFRIVDLLLTNFHLPRSTLFMLAAAFAGLARIRDAYEHAKRSGYRFYSYGDCCLLHREGAG